jgi:hypothetical protein
MSLEESSAVQIHSASAAPENCSSLPPLDDRFLAKVFAITEELFGFVPTIEIMHDPEEEGYSWRVVNVCGRGEPKELVDRQLQWHRRVATVKRDHALRLSIRPVK